MTIWCVLTTNCSNNYGPYHFPEKLIPLMIVNALAGKPLPVYGDGQQIRDWLYVKDHCNAIRRVLAEPARLARFTTLAGGTRSSTSTSSTRFAYCSTNFAPEPMAKAIANKIERELGWKPAETFETGIRKTVEWYLDHQEWVANVQSGAYREWVEKNYAERIA